MSKAPTTVVEIYVFWNTLENPAAFTKITLSHLFWMVSFSLFHLRVMKMLGLKLVGRNHYDPESAVILGKHRLITSSIVKSHASKYPGNSASCLQLFGACLKAAGLARLCHLHQAHRRRPVFLCGRVTQSPEERLSTGCHVSWCSAAKREKK